MNTSAVAAGMVLLPAQGSVADAWTRLEAAVAERGLTVFARIDFAADAAAVGLQLRPTRLLVFGNPRAGTPLLAAAPTAAIASSDAGIEKSAASATANPRNTMLPVMLATKTWPSLR